jgi:hypothetical protein
MGYRSLRLVETAADYYASGSQQRDSAKNAVALEPGRVFTYDCNTQTMRPCATAVLRSFPLSAWNRPVAAAMGSLSDLKMERAQRVYSRRQSAWLR